MKNDVKYCDTCVSLCALGNCRDFQWCYKHHRMAIMRRVEHGVLEDGTQWSRWVCEDCAERGLDGGPETVEA